MGEANNPATGTVLVVGAGPVGLAAACELVRQGARVRVVDALPEPTTQSRAVTVHPRTQEHLAAMGVLAEVTARAQPQTAVEVYAGRGDRPRVRITTDHVDSRYPWVLDLAQPETEAVLREHAARLGVVVERGVALVGLTQDDAGVEVTLTSAGGTVRDRYPWVVGADGGHSAVRAAVGTRIEGVFAGRHFLFADVAAQTALTPDTVRMFAHPDGLGGVFPMPGGRCRFVFLVAPPAPGGTPTVEMVQRLVDERLGGWWRLSDPRWLTYFEVHHGQVPQYRHGRVLLAGDAAHIHSPAAGQGMNTGIQDAVNLAWKLALVATGRAGERLLDSYQEERHPVGAAVVRQTERMTEAMTATGSAEVLRDVALHLLGHLSPVERRIMTAFTETDVAYRGSPAVAGTTGPAAPGDHAPDVPGLRTPGGAEAWIGDMLRRPGHLLLTSCAEPGPVERLAGVLGGLGNVVLVVPATSDPPPQAFVDADGNVAARYGIGNGGVALVRPDGYLGYLAPNADDRGVHAYLADRLHVPAGAHW